MVVVATIGVGFDLLSGVLVAPVFKFRQHTVRASGGLYTGGVLTEVRRDNLRYLQLHTLNY